MLSGKMGSLSGKPQRAEVKGAEVAEQLSLATSELGRQPQQIDVDLQVRAGLEGAEPKQKHRNQQKNRWQHSPHVPVIRRAQSLHLDANDGLNFAVLLQFDGEALRRQLGGIIGWRKRREAVEGIDEETKNDIEKFKNCLLSHDSPPCFELTHLYALAIGTCLENSY